MVLAGGCETESVVVVEPDHLVIAPPDATLIEGESREWRATVESLQGDLLAGYPVVWSTPNPEVIRLSAVTGERVNVEAIRAGTAMLRATAAGRSTTAAVQVLAGPSIRLSTTDLHIEGRQGVQAAPIDVQIANGGNGTLSGLSTRIEYPDGEAAGWLAVGLNGTTAPTSLTVIASAVALQPGVHHATVEVRSPSGPGLEALLDVTFEVAPPPPSIVLGSDAVGLSSSAQSPIPAVATIPITNGGSGTLGDLTVTVEYSGAEAGVRWLTAVLAASEAPTTLHLSALALTLRPGSYHGEVAIHSPEAAVSPVVLTVSFQVAAARPPGAVGGAVQGGGGPP